ncbi:hypothetical protein Kpol_333p6 [Vanderwaltozyma polyspora DSM 70294]|uniref:SAGA-associated factor 11 n=1 Tax=Vanderwaltozyma polyspora (strain ATCC 22028 / DSM 70294 / BCRC 21397 / CBS 2163 / NBRC 10782 / NRRL Y-8283 / UCD 57-17) TaxID=436907 RepID=SGF11_VANPO|nr:uncharacterized protein Kpol_333p6 [Vanderwaltozyma polyspora DSM 70294]A7TSM3.1 RecName: Full=SAGA-associated factor 11 [Vanderwaltozyma polyspora DSM 70294]EDO14736.1 hypothetical protein Kpol_333p6 [Vanderwaltozyma polyspora DSM 70294]
MTQSIDSMSISIYENLISTMIQDIVSREVVHQKQMQSRYPQLKQYSIDPNGNIDINGNTKQQDSSQYFHCKNCGRDVSANRFAAHLQRCLNSRQRR